MKNLILLLLIFTLFHSCGTSLNQSCQMEIHEVFNYNNPYDSPGGSIYLNVNNFNPNNTDCWNYLKERADWYAMGCQPPVTVHVLDSLPDFVPPDDGRFYGSEEIRKKVVLQHIIMANRSKMVVADPFGHGIYVEK